MTPVSRSPASAVQRAIVSIMKASTDLCDALAVTPGGDPRQAVYDGPPEGAAYPYVTAGEHLSISDNDLTSYGREGTETVHVWTEARSNARGQEISDIIIGLLDHQVAALSDALADDDFRCVSVRHEFDQALRDPDPQIRHHVVRFRVCTVQVS